MTARLEIYILLSILIIGCASGSQQPENSMAKEESTEETELFKQAALSYEPSGIELGFTDFISQADLERAISEPSPEANQYASLVLLKLYNYHLSCCNQSYNLLSTSNETDSLLIAYVINEFPCRKRQEPYYPSSCAYSWLQGKEMGNMMDEIQIEIALIEKELTRIKVQTSDKTNE